MANFGNRSDAITVIRTDIAAFIGAYRILKIDSDNAVDFGYITSTYTAGAAPFVTADFQVPAGNANADIATAAALYADLVFLNDIVTLFTGTRRAALSRLSPR